MSLRLILFLFSCLFVSVSSPAQNPDSIRIAHTKDSLFNAFQKNSKAPRLKKDTIYNRKKEVIVNGKRFRVYNNWMSIGMGEGFNTILPLAQSILNVDLHFHISDQYFQLGTFLSGDRFLSFNNYNAHICYGLRREDTKSNKFMSLGPSYSWGFPYLGGGQYSSGSYSAAGLYAEGEWIFKVAYDLGLGVSAFADWNTRQTVGGLRLELFFSLGYRGERKTPAGWGA
ncbi:MAG: hypothetical protein ACHQRM_11335 [Bacteroidia bacterium]